LEPIDKSDIILILEANDVKNARALISKALLQLRMRYRSNN
jgi:SNF2 family DNA or RNA helicase